MAPSHATRAEYYRIGLQSGLLAQDEVQNWAMQVIERLTEPPPEIIELTWKQSLRSLEANLEAVTGERNKALAGQWLLGFVREKQFRVGTDLAWCASKAMHIAKAADLEENVYYEFDGLADEIFLATNNEGGDLQACREHMEEALANYPSPPSPSEA